MFWRCWVKGVEVVIAESPKTLLNSEVYVLVLRIGVWLEGRVHRCLIRHGLHGHHGLRVHRVHHGLRVHELFRRIIGIGLKIS